MRNLLLLPIFLALCPSFAAHAADAPPSPAPPCVLVMASFAEELAAIEKMAVPAASKVETTTVNGIRFDTADIGGQRCVFFLTGMSLVNAAMSTQFALDRFHPQAVFFTGIAGGVNPAFHPGDVIVPAQWRYHAEAAYFNETAPGKFRLADWFPHKYPNFGMIHPDDVQVIREGMDKYERVPAFPADGALVALARDVAKTLPPLKVGERVCQVSCGGTGVSGTVFCDNAEYRKWVFTTFGADCLDMESAAIAQVCWTNKVPCLVVRGLSDLAGGQPGKNEEAEFLHAAVDHSALVLVKILQAYATEKLVRITIVGLGTAENSFGKHLAESNTTVKEFTDFLREIGCTFDTERVFILVDHEVDDKTERRRINLSKEIKTGHGDKPIILVAGDIINVGQYEW